MNTKPKRDFIFIDESGDPGSATDYYIQGLLHITDESLKKLSPHIGAFRYFGGIKKELKSTRLNPLQREHLLSIIKICMADNIFANATVVYVDKAHYIGPYLDDGLTKRDPTKFRHLIIRRLLEFHFDMHKSASQEIELVFDRFHSSEKGEQSLRNYLRTDKKHILPKFLHITQADSRYVEFLQIADWITGIIKEHRFTHGDWNNDNLLKFIKSNSLTHHRSFVNRL